MIAPVNKMMKPAQYAHGHNPQSYKFPKGHTPWTKGRRGKESTNYIHGNGNAPYPVEFTRELKETIRKRDNYTCQKCGTSWSHGKKPHVHHIDYDKNNCSMSNLITLCNICNQKVNWDRPKWTRYFQSLMRSRGLA
jgi:hypothetical protein